MPELVVARAKKLRLPMVPVYGMTETAAMVAAIPVEDFLNEDDPGALPLGGAKIHVDPDEGIRVQTPALFKGYHGRQQIDLVGGFSHGRPRLFGRSRSLARARTNGSFDQHRRGKG